MFSRTLFSILLLSCAAAAPNPKPSPVIPVRIEARVRYAQFASDTLVMSASWVNPVDDGRGAIDSMRVRLVGIFSDTSFIFRPPFPTTITRSFAIPAAAYGGTGGSSTYNVFAQVTTYRRGGNAVPLSSNTVSLTLVDAAPANVTGLNLTATKRP